MASLLQSGKHARNQDGKIIGYRGLDAKRIGGRGKERGLLSRDTGKLIDQVKVAAPRQHKRRAQAGYLLTKELLHRAKCIF